MGAVKDHQANTSLIELTLSGNNVGDAGAAALGRRLAGNRFSLWEQVVPGVCFLFPQMSLCKVVSAVGVAELLSSLCVLLLCFFLCLEGNHSLMRTVVKVDVARFQNRLDQLSLSPFSFASLQCATTARLQDRGGGLRITTVM